MKIEHSDQLAIMRINFGKGNAIDGEMLESIGALLDEVERSDARALIITGHERFFSAGLNLLKLSEYDRAAMRAFISIMDRTMLRLFCWPAPVVAAVNGHAIAGGCVLALQADYRLMTDNEKAKTGLNEVALGFSLPLIPLETLRFRVPKESLRPIALEGRLFDPEAAREVGIIDQVVPAAELETAACTVAKRLAQAPTTAYAQVKSDLQRSTLASLKDNLEADTERWLDGWFGPEAAKLRGAAVAQLRSKG